MFHLIHDLRFAFRVIRRNPVTSAIIVLTLGLGIGANTAMFTMFDAWVLRPLDVDQPERLVAIYEERTRLGERSGIAPANLRDWQDASQTLEAILPYSRRQYNLQLEDYPERIDGARVDAGLFPLLGISPVRGRHFMPEEDHPDGPAVALISHTTWQRRYDFDPEIVGSTVRLDGRLHEIVGVMPAGFEFPEWAQIWTPLGLATQAEERENRYLSAVARLAPGTELEEAQAEMAAISERLETLHPESNAGWAASVHPLRKQWSPPVIQLAMWASMVVAAAVLLVICANVANLLMAQANRRRREVALRTALGAGRRRLLSQTLTESLVLAIAGGGLGAVLGGWWVEWMLSWAPVRPPYLFRMTVDDRALIYTLAVAVVTAALCCLATVARGSRLDIAASLKSGGDRTVGGGGGYTLRRSLVVGEFAVTMLLLASALLMVKSFVLEQQIDPGYRTADVLTLRLSLEADALQDPQSRAVTVDDIVERVSNLSGVSEAGAVSRLPVSRAGYQRVQLQAEGRPTQRGEEIDAGYHSVSRGYFQTLELPLVEGRTFTDGEVKEGADVALVSRALAQQLWPQGDALGQRLRVDGGESWHRVVGITGDVDPGHSMTENSWPRTQIYVPYGQDPTIEVSLAVRGPGDPIQLVPQVRAAVASANPEILTFKVMSLEQAIDQVHWVSSIFSRLFTYYAIIALVIAALGAYGILADSVAQRRREMGVRLALGARPADLLRRVVWQGVRLASVGVVLGLLMAVPATRLLASMLYQVSANDPLVFASVALVLLATAWAAAYLPARRAAQVDPMEVLRFD